MTVGQTCGVPGAGHGAEGLERLLHACGGNVREAARRLGRDERTIRRLVKTFGIDLERIRREARGQTV